MRTAVAHWKSIWRSGDGLGIINSAACIVHCLAMPVLVALGAGFMGHPGVNWAFVVLALLAVRSAVRGRANAMAARLLGIGWALFAVGLALETMDDRLEALAYVGSGILILGHVLNRFAPGPENINGTPTTT